MRVVVKNHFKRRKTFLVSVLYVPNVDGLIRNYFKSYVATRYIELVVEKKQGFNKITLSKDYYGRLCIEY